MSALVRVAGVVLCLAGLVAAGCGPATPSTKTPPANGGKPKPPERDPG